MAGVNWCFEEARRRWESFASRHPAKYTLDDAWLGLGVPSQYRKIVDAGYMTALHGRAGVHGTPRILNWYKLTPAGVEEYRRRFPGSEDLSQRKYENGSEIARG